MNDRKMQKLHSHVDQLRKDKAMAIASWYLGCSILGRVDLGDSRKRRRPTELNC